MKYTVEECIDEDMVENKIYSSFKSVELNFDSCFWVYFGGGEDVSSGK